MKSPLEQFFQVNLLVASGDGGTIAIDVVQDNAVAHKTNHEPQKPRKHQVAEKGNCRVRSRRRREQQNQRRQAKLAQFMAQQDAMTAMNRSRWSLGDEPSPEMTQRKTADQGVSHPRSADRRNSGCGSPKIPLRRGSDTTIEIPEGTFDNVMLPKLPRRRQSIEAIEIPDFDQKTLNAFAA